MKEDLKDTLCKLQERAAKDIEKLLAKPDITPTEWHAAYEVIDIIKDVEEAIKDSLTSAAMEEEYGDNYRRGFMPRHYDSYSNDYGRRRNSMGQYMNGGPNSRGSSYYTGETNSAVMNLRRLMNNAHSDEERMMYQRFIDEAESDWHER